MLQEALRAIFAPGLDLDDVAVLIDRFTSRATRSHLAPLIRARRRAPAHVLGAAAPV
jgi:hypothetical protein